eukprot:jgi/Mesvir1/15409/Mv06593-RA.1
MGFVSCCFISLHGCAGGAAPKRVRLRLEELGVNPELWMTREECTTVARDGTEKTSVKCTGRQPGFELTKEEKKEIKGPLSDVVSRSLGIDWNDQPLYVISDDEVPAEPATSAKKKKKKKQPPAKKKQKAAPSKAPKPRGAKAAAASVAGPSSAPTRTSGRRRAAVDYGETSGGEDASNDSDEDTSDDSDEAEDEFW